MSLSLYIILVQILYMLENILYIISHAYYMLYIIYMYTIENILYIKKYTQYHLQKIYWPEVVCGCTGARPINKTIRRRIIDRPSDDEL
jgi:hypothetical protein